MKDFLLKIKKSLKIKDKEVLYIKKSIRPNNDWSLMFSIFLTFFVLTLSFSFYFYYQVSLGQFFSKEEDLSSDRVLVINQKLLEKITSDIENRRSVRDDVNLFLPSDPSL